MKRIAILLVSAACVYVVEAHSSDAVIMQGDAIKQAALECYPVIAVAPEVEFVATPAEVFAPALASNFVRLVRFPELGSPAVLDGITAVNRGPPKGPTGKMSYLKKLKRRTLNNRRALYADSRRFSITARTRFV